MTLLKTIIQHLEYSCITDYKFKSSK